MRKVELITAILALVPETNKTRLGKMKKDVLEARLAELREQQAPREGMKKKLPKYKDRTWQAVAALAELHDLVQAMTKPEASQFRDALLRIYGETQNGIEDEGFELVEIPPGFHPGLGHSYESWGTYHMDLIEGGVAQLLRVMHPAAGPEVTAEEVEIEIGWKARPEKKVTA